MDPRLPNVAAAYTSLPNRNVGLLGTGPPPPPPQGHGYTPSLAGDPQSQSSLPSSLLRIVNGQHQQQLLSGGSNLNPPQQQQHQHQQQPPPPGYDIISLAKDMISNDRDNQLALVSHLLKNIVNAAVASHLALTPPGYHPPPPQQQQSQAHGQLSLPNLSSPPPPLPPSLPPPPPQASHPNGYAQGMVSSNGHVFAAGGNGYNGHVPGGAGARYPKGYAGGGGGGGPHMAQQPPGIPRYPINGVTANGASKRVTLLPTPAVPPLRQQNGNSNSSNNNSNGGGGTIYDVIAATLGSSPSSSSSSSSLPGQLNGQLNGHAGANHRTTDCAFPWQQKDVGKQQQQQQQEKTGYGSRGGGDRNCKNTSTKVSTRQATDGTDSENSVMMSALCSMDVYDPASPTDEHSPQPSMKPSPRERLRPENCMSREHRINGTKRGRSLSPGAQRIKQERRDSYDSVGSGCDERAMHQFPCAVFDDDEDSCFNKFYCHACRYGCKNLQEFDRHMHSELHKLRMGKIVNMHTQHTDQQLQRLKAKEHLRHIETQPETNNTTSSSSSNVPAVEDENYCPICDKPIAGTMSAHRRSQEHKRKDRLSRRGCLLCKTGSYSRYPQYVLHIDSEAHKKRKEELQRSKQLGCRRLSDCSDSAPACSEKDMEEGSCEVESDNEENKEDTADNNKDTVDTNKDTVADSSQDTADTKDAAAHDSQDIMDNHKSVADNIMDHSDVTGSINAKQDTSNDTQDLCNDSSTSCSSSNIDDIAEQTVDVSVATTSRTASDSDSTEESISLDNEKHDSTETANNSSENDTNSAVYAEEVTMSDEENHNQDETPVQHDISPAVMNNDERINHQQDKALGQGYIIPVSGYFCQLCNKFYSSEATAREAHCKSKAHIDNMKAWSCKTKQPLSQVQLTDASDSAMTAQATVKGDEDTGSQRTDTSTGDLRDHRHNCLMEN